MAVERIVHVDMSRHTQEQAERMIRAATIAVSNQAKQLSPVDTGALRRSITHQSSGLHGEVGTSIEYAPYIEYGTYRTPKQPYLRPALDAVAKQVRNLWGG